MRNTKNRERAERSNVTRSNSLLKASSSGNTPSQSTILAPLTDMTSDNLTTTSRTASACRFCMRHLLISAKADWLADVRSFTRVVDYSRGSLSIAERALRFKLVQALLSPRLSCGMQAFEFRVDARWCEKRCNPVINMPYRLNFHAIILSRV